MEDRPREIPKEIIDTFFREAAGLPQKNARKKGKKTLLLIISLISLSLALSAIIIILYIISYKGKEPGFNKTVNVNKARYTENIVKNGLINRSNIVEVRFDGDASKKSAFLKNSIELTSSGTRGRAALIMKFGERLDLGGKDILILARTKYGTKKMKLILTDVQNRYHEYPDMRFSPNWNIKHVYLDNTGDIDLKGIKELRLEFGSLTAGNNENSTMYLKDITVRRAHK